MITTSPSERITAEVTSWPGVEAGHGSRGEFAFTVGRKQIGHLHGDRVLHTNFPKSLWNELYEAGRIDFHPVFPGRPGHASRALETEDDVRDAIALLRLNYDRVAAPRGFERVFDGLYASAPQELPFARDLVVRAFLLKRARGDLLIYSVDDLPAVSASRQYLGHSHEAMFSAGRPDVPLFVHGADRVPGARATFSRRHTLDDDFEVIPIPGHTPGSTAYLWDSGTQRFLFTADTLYLRGGERRTAVMPSSDPEAYARSLALIDELDFDVLVPWAAGKGEPFHAPQSSSD